MERADGGLEGLIEEAISADGRGHFMSSYDGEEIGERATFTSTGQTKPQPERPNMSTYHTTQQQTTSSLTTKDGKAARREVIKPNMNTQEKEDGRLKMEDRQPQHSPLPWRLSSQKQSANGSVCDTDGFLRIADCGEHWRAVANAKLIVRAVNHADKLAEQLKQCIHTLPLHSKNPVVRQIISESWQTIVAYESEAAQ